MDGGAVQLAYSAGAIIAAVCVPCNAPSHAAACSKIFAEDRDYSPVIFLIAFLAVSMHEVFKTTTKTLLIVLKIKPRNPQNILISIAKKAKIPVY
jgi:hypothetical protein